MPVFGSAQKFGTMNRLDEVAETTERATSPAVVPLRPARSRSISTATAGYSSAWAYCKSRSAGTLASSAYTLSTYARCSAAFGPEHRAYVDKVYAELAK